MLILFNLDHLQARPREKIFEVDVNGCRKTHLRQC